jgi:outer membrane protein OmpA-like peptidoglycan-associated protein
MAESLFASLLHSLDKSNISQIASALGESDQNVSRGMESSIASVLGSVASKAEDPGALRRMLDLLPESAGEVSWAKMAAGLSSPGSTLVNIGKRMLSGIFGSNEAVVANAVGKDTGIGASTATTLLSLAAPLVMRFLSRRVRDEGLSMRSLGTMLQKEGGTIRNALPPGLSDLFWQPEVSAATASPVIAQSVQPETSSRGWLGALALAAAALGCFLIWTHARRPTDIAIPTTSGTANRLAEDTPRLGDYVKRKLPGNVYLNIPSNGVESRLLAIIDGTNNVYRKTWLDFDRLLFDSGSSKLRADSSDQLNNVAAILVAYPTVRLKLAGFTDNVGNAQQNRELSQARAENVKAELVSRGISADRLSTQGYGELASADNTTAEGRARNRRVSLLVAQR